ncbi:hypothetical protein BV898_10712 [Hypsibius exemplaris]|uniref:Tetraspanin n=1 Tax=Hypsibius exemplaris TaxID=2072580 RepID=A0A1W0WIP1_HYPEX|nr:hypothetical protein BV898_10712 [Hypsibius exemplaris]
MNRCTTCLKWLVFVFNLLFWLSGLAILGLAIFLRVDPSTTTFFDGSASIQRYHAATYVLMAVGVIMAIIGFLGCCGALRQSRCMLGTFFALLFVVFVAEVAGGIVAYINKDQLTRQFIEDGFAEIVKKEYGKPGFEARTQYFDVVQSELECCGAKNSWDWFQSSWRGGNGDIGANGQDTYLVPLSCCQARYREDIRCVATNETIGIPQNLSTSNSNMDIINDKGCGVKLMETINKHRETVIGVGVGILVVQVLGLIFAIILCCTIKPERYGYKS